MAGVKGRSGGARPGSGGARPGAGRPALPKHRDMAAAFLLTVMNDAAQPMQDRIAAAGHLLQAGKHASRANQQMVGQST